MIIGLPNRPHISDRRRNFHLVSVFVEFERSVFVSLIHFVVLVAGDALSVKVNCLQLLSREHFLVSVLAFQELQLQEQRHFMAGLQVVEHMFDEFGDDAERRVRDYV